MRISKLAKVASLALAFGLVAGTPAYAVDLQGSGASFPALLIEGSKLDSLQAVQDIHMFMLHHHQAQDKQTQISQLVISGCQMVPTQQQQSALHLFTCH